MRRSQPGRRSCWRLSGRGRDRTRMLDWPLVGGWSRVILTALGIISFAFLLYGTDPELVAQAGADRPGQRCHRRRRCAVAGEQRVEAVPERRGPGGSSSSSWPSTSQPSCWPSETGQVAAADCGGLGGDRRRDLRGGRGQSALRLLRPLRAVVGADLDNQVDFAKDFLPDDQLVKAPADAPLSTVWQPPPGCRRRYRSPWSTFRARFPALPPRTSGSTCRRPT